MEEYPKIKTVYARDPETKYRTLIMGEYALPELEYLANNLWVFTEKVDGTNIRIGLKDNRLVIQGRTANAQIPAFLVDRIMETFVPEKLLEVFEDENFCLYGEGYGAKIQKGGGNYISDGVDFVLFDVKIDKWWLKREDTEDIAEKLSVKCVPVVGAGTLPEMVTTVQNGFVSHWGDFQAEGIVARPAVELFNRAGHRVITKIKTKDFK